VPKQTKISRFGKGICKGIKHARSPLKWHSAWSIAHSEKKPNKKHLKFSGPVILNLVQDLTKLDQWVTCLPQAGMLTRSDEQT
jgi:hypothetical protein